MAGIDAFERLAEAVSTPMVIVTTRVEDETSGCLVGFSTRCSVDPPRYLAGLSRVNRTYEVARQAPILVVHLLHDSDRDRELARLFGEETAKDGVDKFARCEWDLGPGAVPVLRGCDWFGGPVVERVDIGDHVGFVISPEQGDASRADEPFLGSADLGELDPGNPT
jgi:flavin reductase (DIM6/NTAB) family NADH-FMN oxidoreductase RutF